MFEFATAGRIIFGKGSLQEAGEWIKHYGNKALLVVGKHMVGNNPIHQILKNFEIEYVEYLVYSEPTNTVVEKGAQLAREQKVDMVIAMGGGSILDTGKAVAMLATNQGEALDYLEVIGRGRPFDQNPISCIAIPTTSGTGSEVTRNAVISIPEMKTKASLRDIRMLPKLAIIDPELSLDVPANITASTGMDALTQVIEPYLSKKTNPFIDSICLPAIKMGMDTLPICFDYPTDVLARERMAYVSLVGGLALANAGLGAVHGFAAAIGGLFNIPHGVVCACLLPVVFEANYRVLIERDSKNPCLLKYKNLAAYCHPGGREDVEYLIHKLFDLRDHLKIEKLSMYGVTSDSFHEIVDKAGKASSMKANPISLTGDELAKILQEST